MLRNKEKKKKLFVRLKNRELQSYMYIFLELTILFYDRRQSNGIPRCCCSGLTMSKKKNKNRKKNYIEK